VTGAGRKGVKKGERGFEGGRKLTGQLGKGDRTDPESQGKGKRKDVNCEKQGK